MDKTNNDVGTRTITIYKNTFDSKNPFHIDVNKALDRIRTGHSKDLIEGLRKIPITDEHKEERSDLKKKLPAYSFSGKFKWRANDAIQESAGLICLDFDHIENYDKWAGALAKDQYTFAYFRSPSGDGIKVLIKIPPVIEEYRNYFDALRMYFQMDDFEGWDDLKDISRLCYESYDPNLFHNPNSKVFDIKIKEKPVVTEFTKDGTKLTDTREIYRRVKAWADRTNDYGDGNKHKFLVYIASACNRFGLDMEFVIPNLVEDYQHRASPVDSGDFREIVKRVYITYANQHANSFFTQEGEMSDFDPESPARDVIYLSDIRDAMVQSYLKGDAKGETTYFNSIDPHWRWKKGEVNIMHGIPNHGKTTLMLQLMLIKSVKEGTKWGIFSPEQNPPIDFYKDLIHMYVGKSTEHYHPNQMSLAEYNRGIDFMMEHFYFVYPKDDSPTPRYINDRFEELIIKHDIKGCMTDPFNQLDNDWASAGGRDDQYIGVYLSKEKRFALDHDIYKIIVCHPKGNIEKVTDRNQTEDLMNAGNHHIPDQYNLAGGAMWSNKVDNLLATYQPYYLSRLRARRSQGNEAHFDTYRHPGLVQFVSQKIKKQKLIGRPGTANLIYNIETARYHEERLDHDYDDVSIDAKEIYTPFDKEYVHHESMSNPETQVSENDWSAFQQQEEVRETTEETSRQERESQQLEEEL
ncbi:MAG: BT4734/BF3469 family protein, partial [bacterium]|nr:BT4734/BF3469 family protein [bacterium]